MAEENDQNDDEELFITQELAPGEVLPFPGREQARACEGLGVDENRLRLLHTVERPTGVMQSSFTITPRMDVIVADAVEAFPAISIFDYLPEAVKFRSGVISSISALIGDPRLLWAPGEQMSSILLPNGRPLTHIDFARSNLELLQRASLNPEVFPNRLKPYARLTSFPQVDSKMETNRLLFLKRVFFWTSQQLELPEVEHIVHRLVQGFDMARDFDDCIRILFHDLAPRDFFTDTERQPNTPYPMVLCRLVELAQKTDDDDVKLFLDYLENMLRTQTYDSFSTPTINSAGGMSHFAILKAMAQNIYQQFRERPKSPEFLYQVQENGDWRIVHNPPRQGTMKGDAIKLAWRMPDWAAYMRELTFTMIHGMLVSFLREEPASVVTSLQQCDSLVALFRDYANTANFQFVLPDVESQTGKPQLRSYTHLRKR
jgi:hypothetical protein